MGGSPNDIRISDMRPTLVEPPMYKPKVVLLGKDKKGEAPFTEAETIKAHAACPAEASGVEANGELSSVSHCQIFREFSLVFSLDS